MGEDLFKNKYRIKSTRLPSWDYSSAGCYFVTICAKDRRTYFGDVDIKAGEVKLNNLGEIADECWRTITEHFPFVCLGIHCIMPNHVHGIIKICRDEALPRLYRDRDYSGDHPKMSKISPKKGSLPVIVGSFKSAASKRIHKFYNFDFAWQPRYYDQIIWDDRSMQNIYEYIKNNPYNWVQDRNNPAGLLM
jgi:REP element-mobilizing transposase RayT